MFQRLPIALTQVKPRKTSDNLLTNCLFFVSIKKKKKTKKVYNNIIKSM